ncbi:MAG TPA: hypothetical protein VN238_06990 [Solirubrobacteraceae bacterium]|nr:hypothetical protein [Solirubrobacteraceae bacterium]
MEFSVTLDGEPDASGTLPAEDAARILALLVEAGIYLMAALVGPRVVTTGPTLGLSAVEAQRLVLTASSAAAPAVEALLHARDERVDPAVARAVLDVAEGIGVGQRYTAITFATQTDQVRIDAAALRDLRRLALTAGERSAPAVLPATLDPDTFHRELSIAELAERQGVGPLDDPSVLFDVEASDEERDAFMAAIAELD